MKAQTSKEVEEFMPRTNKKNVGHRGVESQGLAKDLEAGIVKSAKRLEQKVSEAEKKAKQEEIKAKRRTTTVRFGYFATLEGSVWPYAFSVAFWPSLLSGILKYMYEYDPLHTGGKGDVTLDAGGSSSSHPEWALMQFLAGNGAVAWTGFTTLISFTIVFRTSQAYSRFWQALDDAHLMLTEWWNAAASVVALGRLADDKVQQENFNNVVLRLFSMLSASALQELSDVNEHHIWGLETLNCGAMDPESITTLDESNFRVELCFQWIMQHITDSIGTGVMNAPPPILGGAYAELRAGMSKYQDASKHAKVPFPFPYAQVTFGLLVIHWIMCPLVMVQWTKWVIGAPIFTFVQVFTLWSLNAIAMGFEKPFGGHLKDMKPHEMQNHFNQQLLMLVEKGTRTTPSIRIRPDKVTAALQLRDTIHSVALKGEGWVVTRNYEAARSRRQRCFDRCVGRQEGITDVATNKNFAQKRYGIVDGDRTAVLVVGIFENELVLALPLNADATTPGLRVQVPCGHHDRADAPMMWVSMKRVPIHERYELVTKPIFNGRYRDFPKNCTLRPDLLVQAYERESQNTRSIGFTEMSKVGGESVLHTEDGAGLYLGGNDVTDGVEEEDQRSLNTTQTQADLEATIKTPELDAAISEVFGATLLDGSRPATPDGQGSPFPPATAQWGAAQPTAQATSPDTPLSVLVGPTSEASDVASR